jgi:GxxExxY protein
MYTDFFPLQEETYQLIGFCMEVHRTLGYGFAEIIYKDAMEVEFQENQLPYIREQKLSVCYKHQVLEHQFCVDFSCFNKIIVEVKSCEKGIIADHIAQLLNYLKVSRYEVGLLINFGKRQLEFQRFVSTGK